MTARRFFTALGIIAVTAVAGAISYRHQSTLALHHGQPGVLAAAWPLCVDGLVMSCGIAIATDRAARFRPRWWALIGFWLGVIVSVSTNWLATDGGLIAHGVSAFPALAFLITVESLSSKPRAAKVRTVTTAAAEPVTVTPPQPVTVTPPPAPEATASPAPRAKPKTVTAEARVHAARRRMPTATVAQIAASAKTSEATARRHLRTFTAPAVASSSAPVPAQTSTSDDTAFSRPSSIDSDEYLSELDRRDLAELTA